MNAPANYQSSSYAKQAAEFQRQHGDLGTPEHLVNSHVPERFSKDWTAWRSAEDFDSKFQGGAK